MLLVFRQHRLALSATGGASATLPAFSDSLFHCGAAIGNLLIGIYKVACLPFDNGVHINKSLHKPRADNIRPYTVTLFVSRCIFAGELCSPLRCIT